MIKMFFLSRLIFIFIVLFFTSYFFLLAQNSVFAAPSISNITDNRSSYTNSQIPRYGKLEITLDIGTTAGTPIFPYDATAPDGARAIDGIDGVSIDAIFTDPTGAEYRQPAFYLEEYDYQAKGGQDWFYPNGNKRWKVRFAPHTTGNWQYRLTAQDKTGIITTQNQAFSVTSSSSKGFIKVSKTDSRYFEFDDGTYFPGLGYNENYRGVDWVNPIQANESKFQTMGQNGIQFIRIWLSQWAIYGKEWSPWRGHTGNGYFAADNLTVDEKAPGHETSMKIDGSNRCMLWGWETYPIAVKQSTNYKIDIRYKAIGLTRENASVTNFGLVVKRGGWLWNDGVTDLVPRRDPQGNIIDNIDDECFEPGSGTLISGYGAIDTSNNWVTITSTFNSGSSNNLGNLYLALENVSSGTAYIDEVSIREDMGNGTFGPNIVPKPTFDHHEQYDMRNAAAFDKTLELAEQNGVYMRLVLLEKNDWQFNKMSLVDGTLTSAFSNDNFYGDWRTVTKSRWLQQAWWRYVQARWGYSTAIHSWELLNEGDPYHGVHYTLTDEMGKYMRCTVFGIAVGAGNAQKCTYNHPDYHMSSTSFWNSFPVDNVFSNLSVKYPGQSLPATGNANNYPNIDFADVHHYPIVGNNSFRVDQYNSIFTAIDALNLSLPGDTYNDAAFGSELVSKNIGAKGLYGPHKPVVRGETGVGDFTAGPLYNNAANSLTWFHAYVWSQINSGGMYDASYWYTNHLYNGTYDNRPQFKHYYDFINTVPVSNGNYIDVLANSTNSKLRVMGQKDLVLGNAHLWVQNNENIVGVTPTAQSGTITVSGFQNNKQYMLETWNTYMGTKTTGTTTSSETGNITLSINNLTTDTAFKIINPTAPTSTPTTQPPSPEPGDVNGDGSVNLTDLATLLSNFGRPGTRDKGDVTGDGNINLSDLSQVLSRFGHNNTL